MVDIDYRFRNILKHSQSGFELELNLIETNGEIYQNADYIINKARRIDKKADIESEATQNMVEMRSSPSVGLGKGFLSLIKNVEIVADACERSGVMLCPLATYPGKFSEVPTKKKRYQMQQKIFDYKLHSYSNSRATSFHYHYALPYGVFDSKKLELKKMVKSKAKKTLINSYNFLIAADPAIITLMQSSPIVDRKFLAKDSRVVLYRSGKRLRRSEKLFPKQNLFKGLPPYIFTMEDLSEKLRRMDLYWRKRFLKLGLKKEAKEKKILDFVWNPVKINKSGTLELRNADANHLKYCIAEAVMVKSVLRRIQQQFYEVEPSEIALKEPFKVEDKTIYIPPLTFVRNKLQPRAVYHGFDSKTSKLYAKRFYKLANRFCDPELKKLLKPMKKMVEREKSVSDIVLSRLHKKGYSRDDIIPQSVCRELALKSAEQMLRELPKTKKAVESLS